MAITWTPGFVVCRLRSNVNQCRSISKIFHPRCLHRTTISYQPWFPTMLFHKSSIHSSRSQSRHWASQPSRSASLAHIKRGSLELVHQLPFLKILICSSIRLFGILIFPVPNLLQEMWHVHLLRSDLNYPRVLGHSPWSRSSRWVFLETATNVSWTHLKRDNARLTSTQWSTSYYHSTWRRYLARPSIWESVVEQCK